jgi:hypothetical protein
MTKNIKNKLYNFSTVHLSLFAKELKEAGGFDELMFKKKSLGTRDSGSYILTYENIDEYKERFLTGDYESLRPRYNTKVPYSFWSQLLIALRRRKSLRKLS